MKIKLLWYFSNFFILFLFLLGPSFSNAENTKTSKYCFEKSGAIGVVNAGGRCVVSDANNILNEATKNTHKGETNPNWTGQEIEGFNPNLKGEAALNAALVSDDEENYEVAFLYYYSECKIGNGDGCLGLSDYFAEGLLGEKDPFKSMQFRILGCLLNSGAACRLIANTFAFDEKQLNFPRALKFWQKACDMSDGYACQNLADAYENAKFGAIKNLQTAAYYYSVDCNRNYTDTSCKKVKNLEYAGYPAKPKDQIVKSAKLENSKSKPSSGKTKQFLTDKQILEALMYEHKFGVSYIGDEIGLSQTYVDMNSGTVTRSALGLTVTIYYSVSNNSCVNISKSALRCTFNLQTSTNLGSNSNRLLIQDFEVKNGVWRSNSYANYIFEQSKNRPVGPDWEGQKQKEKEDAAWGCVMNPQGVDC